MDEFIVWDKVAEKFADNIFLDADLLQDGISYSLKVEEELFELFYPIGIIDIDGKKIYADCSIVEFDYDGDPYTVRLKGYFSMNYDFLAYEIIGSNFKNNKWDKIEYCNNNHKISNMKVIGTLQENPELLES